jgi:hypothetical protein
MKRQSSLLQVLRTLLPAGALGASATLALTSTAAGIPTTSPDNGGTSSAPSVSTRLQEIRAGVSVITATLPRQQEGAGISLVGTSAPLGDPSAVPTWWGNGGFGRWRLGWGNGGWGWHNGGWGNGGWGNGWHNGWGNGWHNGGWHNFWHNG